MKKEIGSEFWSESLNNLHNDIRYYTGLEEFNPVFALSGRTALDLIIEDIFLARKVESVYMPSFCCESMIEPFVKHGVNPVFYDVVVGNGGLECCYEDNSCDIVFLIDYFGFLGNSIIDYAKQQKTLGKIVIYDTTHSLFCRGIDYKEFDYTFASIRKWFAINGGLAIKNGIWNKHFSLINNSEYELTRNAAFNLKRDYIIGRVSEEKKELFLKLYADAEERLDHDYKMYQMPYKDSKILELYDYQELINKRRQNAKYLIDNLLGLENVTLLYNGIRENDVPLFIPIRVKGRRDYLRKKLIEQKIYLPIHWPVSKYHKLSSLTNEIYREELSVVCDQRYDLDDMEFIVKGLMNLE